MSDVAVDPARLRSILDGFDGRKVAVLGDPVLDAYVHGTTVRLSREAPIPIVREDSREHRLGGAANAAANVAALGGASSLVGVIGADDSGHTLTELALGHGLDTTGLVAGHGACTVTKTRVLAGALHTTKQQLLRIDRQNRGPASAEARAALIAAARAAFADADAVIISDYGDGELTGTYADLASEAHTAGKIVVVDSRYALTRFSGVTAVTPNGPEAEAALGTSVDGARAAADAAERIRDSLNLEATLLTRGREGMAVAAAGDPTTLIAVHGAPEAVDVTGAGDTVTAAFTLALAAGASVVDAAIIANCAASVTVQQIGAATCSPAELADSIAEVDLGSVHQP